MRFSEVGIGDIIAIHLWGRKLITKVLDRQQLSRLERDGQILVEVVCGVIWTDLISYKITSASKDQRFLYHTNGLYHEEDCFD